MTRKILVWMHAPDYPIWHMPRASLERIREAAGGAFEVATLEVPLHASGDGADEVPEALLEAIRDAEVYVGFGIPREAFRGAERLRWVHSGAAGVGGSLFPEMRESDVLLTNSAGLHAEPLAEHALALMLHFGRGLDLAAAGADERRWAHRNLAGTGSPVRELAGRAVGVVGYGGIGSAVGRRAAAFGMRVLATRRSPGEQPPEVARMWGPSGLAELLRASDVVVLSVPETGETRRMIGTRELEMLGDEGVLINVSRGDIVDEDALVEALRRNRIRGAGLDVFEKEPLPPDSPLWGLANVVITPHTGAVSPRFWERETDLIVENLRRYRADRPLRNQVDKERGY